MYSYFKLRVKLVGYDFIKSDKGEYIKMYLINYREEDKNKVGNQVLELFEPLSDWSDILKNPEFKPGCVFFLDGYFNQFRFRPTAFGGFEKG